MATKPNELRERRKRRIRKNVLGTSERPRLTVFRSSKHIYAQVIDDNESRSLVAVSSLTKTIDASDENNEKTKVELARVVGGAVAKLCLDKGIKQVVFDRNGYKYHGRVSALAEGAREGGLEF